MNTNSSAERKRYAQESLVTGQATIAEAMGIDKRQLYAIAGRGFQMLSSGRLDEARQIYSGLVAADPYDSVFHCHLGATLWRLGEIDDAAHEFDAAIRLNFANVDALAARGEIRLMRGQVKEGVDDLRKSLEFDPRGEHPASIRARGLLLSLREVAAAKSAA